MPYTHILRGVIYLAGAAALAFCVIALPLAIASNNVGYYRPLLLGMYVPFIPFFLALHQSLKLLGLVDKNMAFSDSSLKAIRQIKYCAVAFGALYTVGLPYIFYVAERDDAPGVVLIGLILAAVPLVIAVVAAVLQKLVQDALSKNPKSH